MSQSAETGVIAFDTNILFPFVVSDHPDRAAVDDFIQGLDGRDDVALSEFALVELYGLLRQRGGAPDLV